uniref:Prefoldin subunit 6 n=1 Tax=Tetraselmis chuii TaxID=63592 RepID=A0A7S1XAN0_9CHLO|mmetsp:Transcript_614/g.1094  ORF Transcript_614/g.1094 Transcript_614/m.1094 type:complete len:129 (+) Transcript_614:206-592(+)
MAATILQKNLQSEVEVYQSLGKDIQKNHSARNTFMTQQGENEMVMKELELLEEDANVFKMIGPVLVKQDLVEAKANVGKRLDYIKGELSRMETGLKNLEKKRNDKEKEIVKMQDRLKDLTHGGGGEGK